MTETRTPINWALRPLRHYADFSERSPRAEFWWFTLFITIGYCVVLMALLAIFGFGADLETDTSPAALGFIILLVLIGIALFLPSLAVQVRRLHDFNISGWWILVCLIPYLGALIVLVFMLWPGTSGPNRFGDDPYGSSFDY